ncbi:MAG: hypothetical protein JWN80_1573 [Microbacteriaceae bacterium]|nr:hypothetical protein [Microbacteriaceae bacterium]
MATKNPAPAEEPTTPAAAGPVPAATPPARKAPAWLTPVLAVVAALVIGLFGGILIGHATAPASTNAGFRTGTGGAGGTGGFGNRTFGGGAEGGGTGTGGTGTGGTGQGGAGGFAGGGVTAGTIVSVNGDTIVVKEANGTQATVNTSGSTTVTKTSKSTVDSLKAGETITVIGQTDSSGNVSATSISEGAAIGRFGGRGGAAGIPTPAPTN